MRCRTCSPSRSQLDPGAGEVLTDDFAPVDVYVADGPQFKKGDER